MSLSHEPRRAIPRASTFLAALLLASTGCTGRVSVDDSRGAGETDPPAPDAGGPTDAGVIVDAAVDADDAGPEVPCPMDWGVTAEVVGTTPSGPFKAQYAWMGYQGGECGGILIGVTETPEVKPETQLPALPLILFGEGDGSGSTFEGAGETSVSFWTASQKVYTKGWVDLTRVDPWPPLDSPIDPAKYPRVEGTISVDGDGFSLAGSFVAPYCAYMNVFCP